MKKWSIFKILMMAFWIPFNEDDGMGGADDGDAGGDGSNTPAEPTPNPNNDSVTLSREELSQLTAPMQELLQERAVNNAVSDIKGRFGDFDLSAVHTHLKELHKSDPAKAEALNTPAGWELIWEAKLSPKSVSADAVNSGRNVDADGGRGALVDRVRNGEASIHERASLFEKYV